MRLFLLAALLAIPAAAQEDDDQPPPPPPAAAYTPADPASSQPALRFTGYADVGFARAQGDGTSFAPGDARLPADYGVDAFAPAVNSRGDAASTDSGGRFTNGFLPRSAGIGGRASFLVNTVDLDVRYQPASLPIFLFTRLQLVPRLFASGAETRLVVEQAFARVSPFSSQELLLSAGKFDSVFGVEYLENEANLRTGVTPSLIARYTTGQSLGVKAFYRLELAALQSAVSLNLAATNGGTLVETLQPQDASLTGTPVLSARIGYELKLARFELKLGASGLSGPRNDQHQASVRQKAIGADLRLLALGFELRAEALALKQDAGGGDKQNGLGTDTVVSGFEARGGYAQLSWTLPFALGALRRVTPYGRYDRRHAQFEGFTPITVDRITAGLRVDLWENLLLKGEALWNRELLGAPQVANDVLTSSLVYSW